MVSVPNPASVLGGTVERVGGLAHRVLTKGLSGAQSVVDRLPGAPADGGPSTGARIGANPQRRYGSGGSRSLAR